MDDKQDMTGVQRPIHLYTHQELLDKLEDQRKKMLDAILAGCPRDGSHLELIIRRAWARARKVGP